MRKTFELAAEPRGQTYHDLMYRAFPWCAELLFVVVAPGAGVDPLLASGRKLIAELEPYLASESDEREWPGTRLESGGTGHVYRYRLHPEVLDLVTGATDRLFGWSPPALPQDVALLRGDGSPFLATVTQEGWASLSLDDDERASLADLGLELRDLW